MRQTDEEIRRQLDKPLTWFVKYFPMRIKNVPQSGQTARQLVYAFKDGKAEEIAIVAKQTAAHIIEQFGDRCSKLVLSCIPASSAEKNESRYKAFCAMVSRLCGCINGYDHVRVIGERLTIHENRRKEKDIRQSNIIEFDKEWFNGKDVLCFDDIITKGLSYAHYANQLESFGANVVGGMFLARTHYNVNRQ